MKEYDKRNSLKSSKINTICISSNNDRHPVSNGRHPVAFRISVFVDQLKSVVNNEV
jgi:hypothetical protein